MKEIMHPYEVRKESLGFKKEIILSENWKRIYTTTVGEYLLYLGLSSFLDRELSQKATFGWKEDHIAVFKNEEG